MPVHDWTRVDAGLFHAFHSYWIVELARALNRDVLPSDYFALPAQRIQGPIPDVLTLKLSGSARESDDGGGGIAIAERAPQTRLTTRAEAEAYARKANHITVHHRHGDVVAILEIVSPGNKASRTEFRALVEKSADFIRHGIHLLIIDLFPPGQRDPQGIHKAIWDEFQEEELELPAGKPLTLASYESGPEYVAYVEFVAVGDQLQEMPLFLKTGTYVQVPLETTSQAAWEQDFPAPLKGLLLPGDSDRA
ncbi:MAG: DUF4058 family protein [Planctomycetes bacterium]|nr:DUF4058 family protein [Planctomycetota bacterium]